MVLSAGAPWLQYTGHQQKRKRAELACTICHTSRSSRQIRCDLQVRTSQGLANCSNCDTAGKECRMRPSKRFLRRARTPLTPPDSSGSARRSQRLQRPTAQETDSENRHDGAETGLSLPQPDWLWDFDNPPPLLEETPAAQASSAPPPAVDPTNFDQENCSPVTSRTEDTETRGLSSRYYELEIEADARSQEQRLLEEKPLVSFVETYLEYCLPWCPSPLLVNALAVVGSHLRPPVMPHDGPAAYYERARQLFYNDVEPDVVRSLQAVSLFYWWSPRPPTVLHRHSSWWWTSVVIRHCQQLGVHQQPSFGPGPAASQHNHPTSRRSHLIRRRIWWTAFARERLTAICQNKPCTIDPEDCDIAEPTLDDFPDAIQDQTVRLQAEIFIYWVRLCGIIGRIAKYLSRPRANGSNAGAFPTHLAKQLIDWVHSLPPHLTLPIHSNRTTSFNREVHQLHLPYLAVIILLHLKQPHHTPLEAYQPAILAASCLARVLRDILSRGSTQWLMAITGWYTSLAFIALLQACRVDGLAAAANEDLDILTLAVDQLRVMWPTANIFHRGFQRLRSDARGSGSGSAAGAEALLSLASGEQAPHLDTGNGTAAAAVSARGLGGGNNETAHGNPIDGMDWIDYFPFATAQTSGIAERLLVPQTDELQFSDAFPGTMMQFEDLFGNHNFSDLNLFM
ncbi:uncharacterized protein BDW70DRAFT_149764 [Aspergillus foveolatus]|uniref:uncharacterized protein n=1 Tax=Aspergillus foveolatus TaxID=210207 RepID=UPI003CCDDCDD